MRHVCRHTNHRVTVIYTFLESPNDIDVNKTLAESETHNNYIYSLWLNQFPNSCVFYILNPFTCFWHMGDNVRLRNVYSNIFYNNFHPQNMFMWYLLQFLKSFMYLVLHQHVLLFTPCCHTPNIGLALKSFKAMCDQSYRHVTFNAKAI